MHRRMGMAALLATTVLVGCGGGDEVAAPVNNPPTIEFTYRRLGVPRQIPVDLTVTVSDPNVDDVLSVSWQITRGNLVAQNADKTIMRWSTPASLGVDTVLVFVTDGTATNSVTATIRVGTRAGEPLARTLYIKAESPYILVGTGSPPIVGIDPRETTVIEAGTEFLVDLPETAFDVFGVLESNGTANDPVVFRPNDRTLTCGDNRGWWKGFRGFSDPPTLTHGEINLSYTNVWYGNSTVLLTQSSSATITGCNIRCSGDDGVKMESSGSLTIADSDITDGRNNGITVKSLATLPASVSISGCNISINDGAGIELELFDTMQQVPITISNNIVEFNNLDGIVLAKSVFPAIHGNTFSANGGAGLLTNIRLRDGYPGGAAVDTLDASVNFWGGPISNQSSIDATVRDELDSAQVGTRLKTWPWCNDAACTIIVP